MELRQLEYLIAVVEEGTFTAGAARVHVAQPGVSAQIRHLEREFGQQLLDRSGRTVRPTAAGAAVLPYARAALAAVVDARAAADAVAGLLRGRLHVGTVTSISAGEVELPRLIADFHDQHPGVRVRLSVGNTDDLLEQLRAGELDVAFVGLGPDDPLGLGVHVVADARVVAAVHPDHVLGKRTRLRLAELDGVPLISLPPGTGLRSCLDNACRTAGFRPDVALEAADPRTLVQLAARGLGVAIIPATVAAGHPHDIHAIALQHPVLHARLALAWRGDAALGPAARELISRVRARGAG